MLVCFFFILWVVLKRPTAPIDKQAILTLYRQSARYGVAANQDKSEIIALLHANYAAGFLFSIKELITPDQFKKATGTDFMEFQKKIQVIQDTATRRVVRKCPALVKDKDPLLLRAMYY